MATSGDIYTLLQVAEAAGVIMVGVGSAWFSRKAARLSEPTGNGFAGDVKGSLARLEASNATIDLRFDRLERRVDMLTDHLLDDGK